VVSPQDVAEILVEFDRPWWIAVGWAIDAFTGTTRDHEDIDVGIFRRDMPRLWWTLDRAVHLWSVSRDGMRPLDASRPRADRRAGQVLLRENAHAPWLIDFLLTPQHNGALVNRRDRSVVAQLDEVTLTDPDGVRFLRHEIVLTFNAKHARPKDGADLERVLPLLSDLQRRQLDTYLRNREPTHQWIPLLHSRRDSSPPGRRTSAPTRGASSVGESP
jgi:hypothetical protein